MRGTFKHILKDKSIKYVFFISTILFFLQIILLFIVYGKLPPIIPLFNSLPWGEERLSAKQFVFALPMFLFIFGILNIFLISMEYRRHALIARMFSVNMLLVLMLSFIALVQIELLVF